MSRGYETSYGRYQKQTLMNLHGYHSSHWHKQKNNRIKSSAQINWYSIRHFVWLVGDFIFGFGSTLSVSSILPFFVFGSFQFKDSVRHRRTEWIDEQMRSSMHAELMTISQLKLSLSIFLILSLVCVCVCAVRRMRCVWENGLDKIK